MSELALLGGEKAVKSEPGDLFKWPIVNKAMEDAVIQVLRDGNMSGGDITREFEKKYAEWAGVDYALALSTGTGSLQCAMFGLGIGCGDQIIAPSVTYWATALPALSLGASVVFADIDPETLCIDPNDIEKRVTDRTKAIVVVHYLGHPADMDPIMAIAKKRGLKVIEDISHAQGGLYKGKMNGTFGDASGTSLMSGKSFAIGEGGIMTTNSREVYERAIMFGLYSRHSEIEDEKLKTLTGLPWGGYKYRMHQMSSAVGLEQLKKYPSEIAEIDQAMNYFWDLLDDVPGVKAHRVKKGSGSTMAGWYSCRGIYVSEELEGLSITRFCKAVAAEGQMSNPGCNPPLHLHPLFSDIDVYGHGKPTQLAHAPEGVDLRQNQVKLPVAEGIVKRVFSIPWFRRFRKLEIEERANAFRKVAENYKDLLADDEGDAQVLGSWGLTARKK